MLKLYFTFLCIYFQFSYWYFFFSDKEHVEEPLNAIRIFLNMAKHVF